ncbi:MAG: rhodanese-like domain-containing protein [Paracoccaceae bacterium]
MFKSSTTLVATIFIYLFLNLNVSAGVVPDKKQTLAGQYLTATQAADMLADPAILFIDVRTVEELIFVGLPDRVNLNLPIMQLPEIGGYDVQKASYPMQTDPEFRSSFRNFAASREMDMDTPIVLICRSGGRSAKAADLLYKWGYTNVFSVIDGFEGDKAKDGPMAGYRVVNGWKNANLPWGYQIEPSQANPADK